MVDLGGFSASSGGFRVDLSWVGFLSGGFRVGIVLAQALLR